MQKPLSTQPELFVLTANLVHSILHSLDYTEALLEWSETENHSHLIIPLAQVAGVTLC